MRILLVDDEQLQLLRLENCCKSVLPDSEFLAYTNPVEAYEKTLDQKIDLAFLDVAMPLVDGIQLAKKLKKNDPTIKSFL